MKPALIRLAWRIARRELRGGLRGFRIFLLCLAMGVGAIAVIGSISAALQEGMRADARKILGGDIDLRLSHRPASAAQRAWLDDRGAVSATREMRSMARTESDHTLVEVKAVDGAYPLFGRVVLTPDIPLAAALAKRDGAWGAAADAALLTKLNLAVGDSVRIGAVTLRIAATIEREPDRAARAFTLGPRLLIAPGALDASGLIQPGSLVRYHYRIALAKGTDIPAWRRTLDATFPKAGWRVRDTKNAAPGLRRLIDRITVFLGVVGLTALLVGGVGVGNAVRAFLLSRADTIATLKCLGASGQIIFAVYLIQVMVLAAAGIAAGLLIGVASPLAAGAIAGDRLPIDIHGGFYVKPFLLAALFGFLVTLVFSLLPLARARAIPAANLFRDIVAPAHVQTAWREAAALAGLALLLGGVTVASADDRRLAVYFVIGAAVTLLTFRIAAAAISAVARRAPRARQPHLRLALGNLHRPGAPTATVATSLGLGLTVLIAVALVEGNLARQVGRSLPDNAPGIYFIDIQPHQADAFDAIVAGFPEIRDMRRVPMLRGRIVKIAGKPVSSIDAPPHYAWVLRGDRGLTWARHPPKSGSTVVEGAWWPADYSGPSLVSFDVDAARALGIAVGDVLTLNVLGREIRTRVANLRKIDWNSFAINFVMILAPGALDGAPQAHIATARADDPAPELALEQAVVARFSNISAIRVREVLARLREIIGHLATVISVVGAVVVATGILVLAGAIVASHKQRIHDAVILKVFGATRRDIVAVFAIEFALLGLVASTIASVIGAAASWAVVTQLMHTEWVFLPTAAATTVAACLAVAVAVGAIGAWSALSRKAAPLLRNE